MIPARSVPLLRAAWPVLAASALLSLWFAWRVPLIDPDEGRNAEVAREIGRPTAARAVARACASNRLALIVPCHRVIREDGSMGGYRWGLQAKDALLDFERKQFSRPAPVQR